MSGCENNAPHLHRSRSATSVKERKKHPLPAQPLDPETSRVHALIAAHRAMDRSQSRSSTDIGRSDSNASRRTADAIGKAQNVRFSPATQLRRQRSALQTKAPRLSAALRVPPHSQADDPCVNGAVSDFGPGMENYGSEPSSYRRIRRARSLLTPRRRLFSNTTSPIHTPFSQAPTLRTVESSSTLPQPGLGLRIKRSLTFLRPASRVSAPPRPETHIGHTDEAVRLARTQFLNDMEDHRVQDRPSVSLSSKARQPGKPFRKSVRSRQPQETDGSMGSDTTSLETSKPSHAKWSVSATLRDRVLRAFGRSASTKPTLPPQQLEATRQYFSDAEEGAPLSSFDNYHVDQDEKKRESFYVPSCPEADDEEERDRFSSTLQTAGSRESLHSNARSRVTSWTNSTVTTSTARGTGLERNRLSIIKEDGGPHQPSCSAGRHIGGIGAFQDPLETKNEEGYHYPVVDSQRIYSALMKRIGEEEAEIEHTQSALEDIHQRQYGSCDPVKAGKSTVRAVSSTTIGTMQDSRNDIHNERVENELLGMSPGFHQENLERRKAKLASQEDQSSFYPFSDQGKPQTPSPFRKLLEARRSDFDYDSPASPALEDTSNKQQLRSQGLVRGRFGLSSESIYSHTTDGGENPDYVPQIGSSDNLPPIIQEVDGDTGMATIIPARYRPNDRLKPVSADSNERREWKGWIEGELDASLGRRDYCKTGIHYREHAQVYPEDIQPGQDERPRPSSRASGIVRFPLLDLKEVPRNTPAPKRSGSLTKSQSGLLKRASTFGLKTLSEHNDENKKIGSGIRKLSPTNFANMLREKRSQMMNAKVDEAGKENKPSPKGDSPRSSSPPMSTPGRLGLQMRSGNGRLRKRASDMAVKASQKYQITPKNVSTPMQSKREDYDVSPSDRVKQSLSARLSRPFNMDVPEPNRPFDSMYLGKQEISSAANRLSTAPNTLTRPKRYGGLGGNPFDEERDDTALPQIRAPSTGSNAGASTAGRPDQKGGSKGVWSSKRMVSDFLRKRRIGKGANGSEDSTHGSFTGKKEEGESPAFV